MSTTVSNDVPDVLGPLIVIPCLDEAAHLPGLLDQFAAECSEALVVVADGGSTDGTQQIARDHAATTSNIRLLHNPLRLQSAAMNLAAAVLGDGRPWIVRIDAHCVYPKDYVSRLIGAAERTGADAVTVSMITLAHGGFQSAVATAMNSMLGAGGSPHRRLGAGRFVDHGHHALISLEAYRRVGGYDETFSHNEDAELDARLLRGGFRIWLEPEIAVGYYPRNSPGALFAQYLKYGAGRARTVQRHRAKLKLRQIGPLAIPPIVVLAGTAPLAGWWVAAPAAGWTLAALVAGVVLGVRGRDAWGAASGVAAMVAHLAWSLGFWRQSLFGPRPGPEPSPIALTPSGSRTEEVPSARLGVRSLL